MTDVTSHPTDRREDVRRESDEDLIKLVAQCGARLDEERRLREALMTALHTNDDKQEEGHRRLRESIRDLTHTVESNYHHFDDQTSLMKGRLTTIEAQSANPIDATRLVLSTRGVAAVVVAVLAIWTGQWFATSGVRDDIRAVAAQVSAQKDASTAREKLEEMQMKVLSDAVQDARNTAADAKRQYELLRYDFQALKETVIGKGKTP